MVVAPVRRDIPLAAGHLREPQRVDRSLWGRGAAVACSAGQRRQADKQAGAQAGTVSSLLSSG